MEFGEVEEARGFLREYLSVTRLLVEARVVAEPAGAASTAAFLQSGGAHAGQAVVLLVTGSNLTPEILRLAVLRG